MVHSQAEQMKIILIRHGRPTAVPKTLLSPLGFGHWLMDYKKVGIDKSSSPDKKTKGSVESSKLILCSDLTRSIESAKILGKSKQYIIDKSYQEVEMPFHSWVFPKLSPTIWVILNRTLWFLGYSKNCESYSNAKSRSIECAQKLQKLAKKNQSIVLVGHGFMNRFIGRQLLKAGWLGPKRQQSDHWGVNIYLK